MLFVLVLAIGVLGIAIYLLVIYRAVPGAVEERFGTIEIPGDVGVWRADETSPEGLQARDDGLKREVRHWLDESGFGRPKLLKQVRLRSRRSNEIVRVEPDEVVKLKRTKT